jgi:hypothetical protein
MWQWSRRPRIIAPDRRPSRRNQYSAGLEAFNWYRLLIGVSVALIAVFLYLLHRAQVYRQQWFMDVVIEKIEPWRKDGKAP